MPSKVLVADYQCVCGQKHEAVGRVGGQPVIMCPLAPLPVLYYFPGMPALITGPHDDTSDNPFEGAS